VVNWIDALTQAWLLFAQIEGFIVDHKIPPIPASQDQRFGKEAQRAAILAEQKAGVFDRDSHLRNSPIGQFLAKYPQALAAALRPKKP
jgi:hypothetical protein